MLSAAEKLLGISHAANDRQVAMMIAEMFIEASTSPYRFAINHNVRPPKCIACPLHYDWVLKDRVGIETGNLPLAKKWLQDAAMRGYTIYKADARHGVIGVTSSLAIARRRAEIMHLAAARAASGKVDNNDDDIPF